MWLAVSRSCFSLLFKRRQPGGVMPVGCFCGTDRDVGAGRRGTALWLGCTSVCRRILCDADGRAVVEADLSNAIRSMITAGGCCGCESSRSRSRCVVAELDGNRRGGAVIIEELKKPHSQETRQAQAQQHTKTTIATKPATMSMSSGDCERPVEALARSQTVLSSHQQTKSQGCRRGNRGAF